MQTFDTHLTTIKEYDNGTLQIAREGNNGACLIFTPKHGTPHRLLNMALVEDDCRRMRDWLSAHIVKRIDRRRRHGTG